MIHIDVKNGRRKKLSAETMPHHLWCGGGSPSQPCGPEAGRPYPPSPGAVVPSNSYTGPKYSHFPLLPSTPALSILPV